MTRKEYMEQLRKYLKRLPKEDYENAIEYFSEYFDEAGPENEQQVMEELGEPKEAARELLLNLLQESVGDGKDSTGEKETELPAEGSGNRRQKVPATDGVQQDKIQLLQPVILQRRNVLRVRSSSLQFLSSVRHR